MTSRSIVSLTALAAALALAGCNKADSGANTLAADNIAATVDNEAAAVPPEDLPLPAGDDAVVEDESTAPAIQVVTVPAPAPSTPAADSAPLTDAIAAEQVIDAGAGITRMQQADGWAWLQDGQIIRTASADGHRVSYFRRGSNDHGRPGGDTRDRGHASPTPSPTPSPSPSAHRRNGRQSGDTRGDRRDSRDDWPSNGH